MQTLEQVRKSRGVTATAAHHALGCSRVTYYKYEANPAKMPVGKFVQLCGFLHAEPTEIFLGEASSFIDREEVNVGEHHAVGA